MKISFILASINFAIECTTEEAFKLGCMLQERYDLTTPTVNISKPIERIYHLAQPTSSEDSKPYKTAVYAELESDHIKLRTNIKVSNQLCQLLGGHSLILHLIDDNTIRITPKTNNSKRMNSPKNQLCLCFNTSAKIIGTDSPFFDPIFNAMDARTKVFYAYKADGIWTLNLK